MAEVTNADGSRNGVHYWNRLPDGAEVDLTREQFRAGEMIGSAGEMDRPPDVRRGRLPGNYHLLRARLERVAAGRADRDRPVSIKAVCADETGCVLLCRNHRGEWELPGGRPHPGELFSDCVTREVREETGLVVAVDRLIAVVELDVIPDAWVDVIGYRCPAADAGAPIQISEEHTAAAFLDPQDLSGRELAAPYRSLIQGA